MEDMTLKNRETKAGFRHKVAEDIMIREHSYPLVSEEATIRDAISELVSSFDGYISNKRLIYTVHRSILVVDARGSYTGILTVRKLIQALVPPVEKDHDTDFWTVVRELSLRQVKDIMIRNLVRVPRDMELTDVVQQMATHNTRRVAVVDQDDEIVGILREQELFIEMASIIL